VAKDENRFSRVPPLDHLVIPRQRFSVIGKPFDDFALPVRLAMAKVIQPVNGVTQGHKVVYMVREPSAVFTQPMDKKQNGLYVSIRKPGLIINIVVSHTLEPAIDMFHGVSISGSLCKNR
jgi:hypothetical protein